MSTYAKLDEAIVAAIEARKKPLYAHQASVEAGRLAEATGRESFRVIDGHLQALRKAGRIHYVSKARPDGTGGWRVVGN